MTRRIVLASGASMLAGAVTLVAACLGLIDGGGDQSRYQTVLVIGLCWTATAFIIWKTAIGVGEIRADRRSRTAGKAGE